MTTFKPGDKVRRKYARGGNPNYPKGAEFIVASVTGSGDVYSPDGDWHDNGCVELVEEEEGTAVTEIKKGDRVRATTKEGDDAAEFTTTHVNEYALYSDKHLFDRTSWDFEVLKRALPTVEGSVVRLTRWCGAVRDWTALLTRAGWRISCDNCDIVHDADAMSGYATEFEVLYTPTEKEN